MGFAPLQNWSSPRTSLTSLAPSQTMTCLDKTSVIATFHQESSEPIQQCLGQHRNGTITAQLHQERFALLMDDWKDLA